MSHSRDLSDTRTIQVGAPLFHDPPPPRRRPFLQDARDFAWTLAGFAVTFLCGAAGWVLLEPLVMGK